MTLWFTASLTERVTGSGELTLNWFSGLGGCHVELYVQEKKLMRACRKYRGRMELMKESACIGLPL